MSAPFMGSALNHRPFFLPEDWPTSKLPWITGIIEREVECQWPPFLEAWYGDRYRDFAMDPDWLARSFIANAEKEAAGARSLWKIAAAAHRHSFAAAIAAHARDEARHARMYLGMLELTMPGALDPLFDAALRQEFPAFLDQDPEPAAERSIEALLDDLVQMNIGEIRTRLHQLLLRPVALAVAPLENRQRLAMSLERIYQDEGRHILYTSHILENYGGQGHADEIAALYDQRLRDFSQLTLAEVGSGSFD